MAALLSMMRQKRLMYLAVVVGQSPITMRCGVWMRVMASRSFQGPFVLEAVILVEGGGEGALGVN